MIRQRREAFGSISDEDYDYNNEENIFCENCASFGFPNQKMGIRYYRSDELINGQVPADWENYWQCHRCWTTIPKTHGKHRDMITGIKDIDSSDSQYNTNKTIFLPVHQDSLARRKIKYIKFQKDKRSSGENTDPDISAAKKKGHKVTNITEYNRY